MNDREESVVFCWTEKENTDPFPAFRVILVNVVLDKVEVEEEISINGEEESVKEEKLSEVPMNVPLPRERRDAVCVYESDDTIDTSLISTLPDDVMETNEHARLLFTLTLMSLTLRPPLLMIITELVLLLQVKDELMLKVVLYSLIPSISIVCLSISSPVLSFV